MLMFIKRKNLDVYFIQERCYIEELTNDESCPHLSVTRCTVKPGVTTQLHALKNTREVYLIESGSGIMDDGQSEGFAVTTGDSVNISPNHPQRIYNNTKSDLVFLATCTPRFLVENYLDLESID